jgi:hypothetical protein
LEKPSHKRLESILASNINWLNIHSLRVYEPLPRIDCEVREEAEKALASMTKTPADKTAVSSFLYRLQGHYWVANMSESLAKSVAEDYVRLLGDYAIEIYQMTYDAWLLNPENKFFPKVGEFSELLKSINTTYDWRITKLKALLNQGAQNE